MNCKKIQELILTDYLDGQIDGKAKESLEEHLARCPDCGEFARVAKKSVFEPFLHIKKPEPPESVWLRIKELLLAKEQQKTNLLMDFWEKLSASIPNPVLAFATVLTFILMVGTLNQFKTNPQINTSEQEEYLTQLTDVSVDLPVNDEKGFGTLVERYFL